MVVDPFVHENQKRHEAYKKEEKVIMNHFMVAHVPSVFLLL